MAGAQFNLEIAQGPCMAYPDLIVAKELEGITAATALSGEGGLDVDI